MQVGKRHIGNRFERGWYQAVILAIAWLLILSLARDVWQMRKGFSRITEAGKRLSAEEARNLALKNKMSLVLTDDFKEKLIREKLNMQKEGEILIVMPEEYTAQKATSGEKEDQVPNWEKWWLLIAM
ncbi:MAG: hypothetical protein ACD_61C00190G0011 [uncultured bacterium]|nr:MAG: hypothetical protein ACD_61C00190G0011 [uncultured bacterium]